MTGKRKVAETAHVVVYMITKYDEYRVAYKGLLPERCESMAYYTDDRDDAIATMNTMEKSRHLEVFHSDIRDRSKWTDYFTPTKLA